VIAALEGKKIQIALLPINGCDYLREEQGIVGNLDYREAVQLARRIAETPSGPDSQTKRRRSAKRIGCRLRTLFG
jgi:hypothetical protein